MWGKGIIGLIAGVIFLLSVGLKNIFKTKDIKETPTNEFLSWSRDMIFMPLWLANPTRKNEVLKENFIDSNRNIDSILSIIQPILNADFILDTKEELRNGKLSVALRNPDMHYYLEFDFKDSLIVEIRRVNP